MLILPANSVSDVPSSCAVSHSPVCVSRSCLSLTSQLFTASDNVSSPFPIANHEEAPHPEYLCACVFIAGHAFRSHELLVHRLESANDSKPAPSPPHPPRRVGVGSLRTSPEIQNSNEDGWIQGGEGRADARVNLWSDA